MTQLPYPESSELIAATQAGLYEVFGQDSFTAKLLLGQILGAATLDGLGVVDLSPESPEDYSFDQPPQYAERAIRTNDPEELAALISEAFDRLTRCLPAEYVEAESEPTSQEGRNLYARRMSGWGDTSEDKSLGAINIHLGRPKNAEELVNGGNYLARIEYAQGYDGKIWLSAADRPDRGIVERLSISQLLLTDPLTKEPIVSTNVSTRYDVITKASGSRPLHTGYGLVGPVDVKIKATMFYYLDEIITYYEMLRERADSEEQFGRIGVEQSYQTKIYEYLSRLQDVIDYENGSLASSDSKLLASRP